MKPADMEDGQTQGKDNRDVQSILDSLDADLPEQEPTRKDKYKSTNERKQDDEKDILGFLDELTAPRPSSQLDKKSQSAAPQTDAAQETDGFRELESARPVAVSVEQHRTSEIGVTDPRGVDGENGGWLGSFWNTASTTLKQTQEKGRHFAQTFQESAEGQYLQSHIKQNLSTITSISSSLINTLAPPIGSHEQLRVHTYHDMVGISDVEHISYVIFERVMSQVEGGELVVQAGKGSARRNSATGKRELNACDGRQYGEKLARATLEKVETSAESEEGGVRRSDIYLAIQPTILSEKQEGSVIDPEKYLAFTIYLLDPRNALEFATLSQALPHEWMDWLDRGKEYLIEWIEEALALGIGVVAQRYVAQRMGLGENKGKEKEGGELARAGI